MLHRSKSKDRDYKPPGPSFMSPKQVSEYLTNLRSNSVSRPNGSRPLPPSKRNSTSFNIMTSPTLVGDQSCAADTLFSPRSSSALGSRREPASPEKISTLAGERGRPLVQEPQLDVDNLKTPTSQRTASPDMVYQERGQRWMERQETRSLSLALQDMDLEEQKRIHAAAQDEASDLVWKHKNPTTPYKTPTTPYSYREHLRQGSYSRSLSQTRNSARIQQRKRGDHADGSDESMKGTGGESGSSSNQSSRVSSLSSIKVEDAPNPKEQPKERIDSNDAKAQKTETAVPKGPFSNPADKIYEDPESTLVKTTAVPSDAAKISQVPMRRNPFSRAHLARDGFGRSNTAPLPETKRFDRFEIHRNPPTQSRNPNYTSSPKTLQEEGELKKKTEEESIPKKDGIEIRSDDIRSATSMKLKDRSSKLPTPTYVSDSPSRPIVSFESPKAPRELVLQESLADNAASETVQSTGPRAMEKETPKTNSSVPTITIGADKKPSEKSSTAPKPYMRGSGSQRSSVPSITVLEAPVQPFNSPAVPFIKVQDTTSNSPLPTIQVQENRSPRHPIPRISVQEDRGPKPPIPTINVQDDTTTRPPIPVINAQEESTPKSSRRSVPTINVYNDHAPSPLIPTINVEEDSPRKPRITVNSSHAPSKLSTRPLPNPKTTPYRPGPRHAASAPVTHTGHWTPSNRGNAILCNQCALPISGRIVSAASHRFHPECFTCYHCGEGLECVAFYPEPDAKRAERVDRIQRRMNGEDVEGEERDGDKGLRFYCHLDFHEFFSPRCKSCKTPIEGEVVVACGAEWHVGHFFCAQCGDPFDSQTPFVEKDGYAWCVGCHTNRYSTKCKKCRKPVTDMVVKALGAEWHQSCFCCVQCNSEFDDGRFFLKNGEQKDPICFRCEEIRLKA
ncbi:hypothetical protein M501DRAFT_998591 [Patellaria atrata CBS 101060]|uniref:LIM zinc-binding domain-containing protein n=1 Tax=Patellaria atrata CBS 101060 TaxID=1346257 RepID=A0A9P4SIB2_9PEZI|nr:hypothetical protein M501DRAFT_998591 [Patellaria atrata CBS 101060]